MSPTDNETPISVTVPQPLPVAAHPTELEKVEAELKVIEEHAQKWLGTKAAVIEAAVKRLRDRLR